MNYSTLRQHCQTGAALGVKGKGVFSWVIKKVTKEEFSHVAMLVWHGTSLWVYEFVEGTGYQCVPASWWFDQRHGQEIWYGECPPEVEANYEIVIHTVNEFRGKKVKSHYGIISLLKVALSQWTKKKIRVHFKVCSTFVQHVWDACGVQFTMTADPGDIMRKAETITLIDTSERLY